MQSINIFQIYFFEGSYNLLYSYISEISAGRNRNASTLFMGKHNKYNHTEVFDMFILFVSKHLLPLEIIAEYL